MLAKGAPGRDLPNRRRGTAYLNWQWSQGASSEVLCTNGLWARIAQFFQTYNVLLWRVTWKLMTRSVTQLHVLDSWAVVICAKTVTWYDDDKDNIDDNNDKNNNDDKNRWKRIIGRFQPWVHNRLWNLPHERVFHRVSNSTEISFCSHPSCS